MIRSGRVRKRCDEESHPHRVLARFDYNTGPRVDSSHPVAATTTARIVQENISDGHISSLSGYIDIGDFYDSDGVVTTGRSSAVMVMTVTDNDRPTTSTRSLTGGTPVTVIGPNGESFGYVQLLP